MSRSTLYATTTRTVAIACVVFAGSGCSSAARTASIVPAPCADAPALAWMATSTAPRRVAVQLEVLAEASGSWHAEGSARLRAALATWNRAGIPVRLSMAERGERIDVRVFVMQRLPVDAADGANAFRAGITHLTYDATGAISGAQVLVAEQTPRGKPYSTQDQAATLLHELGHALGVPHSAHPYALMSARTVAMSLTSYDVALAREVYAPKVCGSDAMVTASRPY